MENPWKTHGNPHGKATSKSSVVYHMISWLSRDKHSKIMRK